MSLIDCSACFGERKGQHSAHKLLRPPFFSLLLFYPLVQTMSTRIENILLNVKSPLSKRTNFYGHAKTTWLHSISSIKADTVISRYYRQTSFKDIIFVTANNYIERSKSHDVENEMDRRERIEGTVARYISCNIIYYVGEWIQKVWHCGGFTFAWGS